MPSKIVFNLRKEYLNPKVGKTKLDLILPLPVPVAMNQVIGYFLEPDSAIPQESLSNVAWELPEGSRRETVVKGELTFSEDDPAKIISKKNGFLTVVDNKLSISLVYEIFKDVNNRTGNIETEHSVLVHGGVSGNVEIVSGGDVEVRGLIESASIRAKGKIIAKGGITGGEGGKLVAGGDVYCQFSQQAHIEVMGNLLVEGSIMNSTILCGKKITIKGKGFLVGGKTMARDGIDAGKVGTDGAIQTEIELGCNPFRRTHIERIEKEITALQNSMVKVELSIRHMEKEMLGLVLFNRMDLDTALLSAAEVSQNEGDSLSDEKRFQLNKYGSGVMRLMRMAGEIDALKEELKHVSSDETMAKGSKLKVTKTAHPGVTITIHGTSLRLLKEYDHTVFYYDPQKGEILAGFL